MNDVIFCCFNSTQFCSDLSANTVRVCRSYPKAKQGIIMIWFDEESTMDEATLRSKLRHLPRLQRKIAMGPVFVSEIPRSEETLLQELRSMLARALSLLSQSQRAWVLGAHQSELGCCKSGSSLGETDRAGWLFRSHQGTDRQ